jgi:hypothetical protein
MIVLGDPGWKTLVRKICSRAKPDCLAEACYILGAGEVVVARDAGCPGNAWRAGQQDVVCHRKAVRCALGKQLLYRCVQFGEPKLKETRLSLMMRDRLDRNDTQVDLSIYVGLDMFPGLS